MSKFEQLVEQAWRRRVIQYSRTHEDDVTIQIGRVLYTTSRKRAEVLLRDALIQAPAGRIGSRDLVSDPQV